MKKLGFVILGIAIMLSSCVKENAPAVEDGGGAVLPGGDSSEELVEKVIKVSAPATRTALADTDGDGIKDEVVWTAGDQIAVWDGFACRRFVMTGEPKGNIAEFRGYVSPKSLMQATKFYAVYPYRETFITETPPTDIDEGVARGYARMLFPSSQYQIAKPGGFDKNAAYAIAETSDLENMTFIQKIALLKFKLDEDMNDVVAVKIRGNESNDYIWGTMSMRFLDGGEIYPGVIQNKSVNPDGRGFEITLKKDDGTPLLTREEYYFAIPATLFGRGYKLTFVHQDGSTSSRSSAKPIEFNTTRIYEIAPDAISRSMLHSYKKEYERNERLTVCGYDCLKQYYGDPIVINSNQEYTITTRGAYFIEPGARVTLNVTSNVDKLMIVGDNKFERSVITQTGSVKLQNEGYFQIRNVDLTFEGADYNMIAPAANLKRIEMQGCILRYNSPKNFLHSQTANIERLAFYDNDIIFTRDNEDIFFVASDTGTPLYKSVIFKNNLFYHTTPYANPECGFMLLNGPDKMIHELSMIQNTFVNLKTRTKNAYYLGGTPKKINDVGAKKFIHNNLFYLPNLQSDNGRLYNGSYSTGCDKYGVTYYTGTNKEFKFSDTTDPVEGSSKSYQLTESPFDTSDPTKYDPANGIFVVSDTVLVDGTHLNTIGAQRPLVIE